MGKQKSYRFPQSINRINKLYFPHRHATQGIFPNITFNGDVNGTRYYDISQGFELGSEMYSGTDPFGSYTGVPMDEKEIPIQDADDL